MIVCLLRCFNLPVFFFLVSNRKTLDTILSVSAATIMQQKWQILLFLLFALSLVHQQVTAIYPEDHFSFSKKLTTSNFENEIKEAVDSGKTMFVRWIASAG